MNQLNQIKKIFAPFFLDNGEVIDDIIVNINIKIIIQEIKNDKFYAGNIELSVPSILFNINISFYKIEKEDNEYYTHYTNAWKDITDKRCRFNACIIFR